MSSPANSIGDAAWRTRERSRRLREWLVQGALALLQGIVEVVRCLICLRTGGWPRRLHDVEEMEKIILEQRAAREANS